VARQREHSIRNWGSGSIGSASIGGLALPFLQDRNEMRAENAGGKAIRCNCLAGGGLKREDEMGRFGRKRCFGFSKALLSTTQPPHKKNVATALWAVADRITSLRYEVQLGKQARVENIAKNKAFPICDLIADIDFVACSQFYRGCQLSIAN